MPRSIHVAALKLYVHLMINYPTDAKQMLATRLRLRSIISLTKQKKTSFLKAYYSLRLTWLALVLLRSSSSRTSLNLVGW